MRAPGRLLDWPVLERIRALAAERDALSNRWRKLKLNGSRNGELGRTERRLRELTSEILTLENELKSR